MLALATRGYLLLQVARELLGRLPARECVLARRFLAFELVCKVLGMHLKRITRLCNLLNLFLNVLNAYLERLALGEDLVVDRLDPIALDPQRLPLVASLAERRGCVFELRCALLGLAPRQVSLGDRQVALLLARVLAAVVPQLLPEVRVAPVHGQIHRRVAVLSTWSH